MVVATEVQTKVTSVLTRADLKRTIAVDIYDIADNDYGEPSRTFNSQTTFDGIVLDYVQFANKYDKAGLFQDSTFIILAPYNTTLEATDQEYVISFGGKDYDIIRVSKPTLGEEFILKRVFVREQP